MARVRPPEREDQLLEAATALFIARGYRRTRMADVAEALAVSPGTVYAYAESKEALFHLLVEHLALGPSPERALPVPTPGPGETVRLVEKGLDQVGARPVLDAAVARRRVGDVDAELDAVVRELYTVISRGRRFLALVERCAADLPELHEAYYLRRRRGFHAQLARYLQRRIDAGLLRPVPDVAVAARFVNESVTWFAWHRFGDADTARADEAVVLDTVSDLVRAALRP